MWISNFDSSVVFLHGITGNREATWTAKGSAEPWPQKFLPSKLPKTRILGFGYDARVTHWRAVVSKGRIADHAKALLAALANHRADDSVASYDEIIQNVT
jgi:protein SERAC1